MNDERTLNPGASLLLGVFFMTAGILAGIACLYGAVTGQWPEAMLYLIGVLGGVSAFMMGLRRAREACTSASQFRP